jgi:hypothetical protein
VSEHGAPDCTVRRQCVRQRARLTAPEILDAIRQWTALYGEPPTMADWDPYRARQISQEWRIKRYDSGDWPSLKSVRNHFGRLSDAVAAAGLVPRRQGQQRPQVELALDVDTMLHISYLRKRSRGQAARADLAAAIRQVAQARESSDPADLRVALVDLAAAALAWASDE